MKLLLALLLLGAFVKAEEEKCEDGTTWMMDCNQCTCMNGMPACTEKACLPGDVHPYKRSIIELRHKRDTADLVVKDNSYKQHCRPGDVWKDQDCNRCYCDDTNKGAVCTKKRCPNGQKLEPTPGWEDIFNINNNRRKRSEEKRFKRETEELVIKDNSYKQQCVPGDEWKDQDCNRCYCEDDKKAVCTKRRCSDGKKLEPTPGWEDIFNINHNRNKRSEGSTVIKPDSYNENCVLGDRWMDQDCNECYCDHIGAVCTRRLCYEGKRLTPTSGWEKMFDIDEDISNTQRRRKRSDDLVVKPNSYKQGCVDGDVWMDQDCNKCNCNNKIPRCTRKMCPDSQKLDPTPGWENKFNIKAGVQQ